ncbi:MAG: DUF2851 family protein [Bacteroidota bacterium]|nr:DUF2851 family protein [Bacteroidota bacterium]
MSEEFLYYIWEFGLFNKKDLCTTNGDELIILNPGFRNKDSGPDFTNARIKIGNTTWSGNIEIHINSSDWILHKHNESNLYNSVILHVVINNNKIIKFKSNIEIPTLSLKERINKELYSKYSNFCSSKLWIPCKNSINNADKLIINNFIESLSLERLEDRISEIKTNLIIHKNDWNEILYQRIALGFGFKTNSSQFELLAKYTPLNIILKNKDNPKIIESLLYGQAGLLSENYKDKYPGQLLEEYLYLKQKYSLKNISIIPWKFMRMRPMNFPTIRISQFADLLNNFSGLFSRIIDCKYLEDIKSLLKLKASEYWNNHYIFDEISDFRVKELGDLSSDILIINAIIPVVFAYGKILNSEKYINRAISLLENVKGEKNNIIKKWDSLGIKGESAFYTQGLLQLYNNYCLSKKCLECRIGNNILRKDIKY